MTAAVDAGAPGAVSRAFAESAAWAAARAPSDLVSIRLGVAELSLAARVDLASGDAVFASPAGARFAGFGAAAEISSAGEDRFASVARAGERLLRAVATLDAATPRLVGGLSFEAEDPGEPWAPFGQSTFRLPRFLVEEDEDGAQQVTITAEACVFRHPDALADELARRAAGASEQTPARRPEPLTLDDAAYEALVARAIDAIDAGEMEKVVLARRDRVATSAGRRVGAALRALMREPGVTVFGFRVGERAFVGATPELLVSVHGDRVHAEAVAGSRPRRGDDAAELAELVSSEKDDREHAVVRAAIVSALAARCEDARVGARGTRSLAFVHHLVTPIDARRGEPGAHVLELAGALHPTPAMAGCPSSAARAYLRREEGFSRGWYASPFGWFDARGEGELVVGIRSALLDREGAWVFAGAGIVRGSEPRREAHETRAKLGSILSALGRHG